MGRMAAENASHGDATPVLALVRDLMFVGRITATAQAAGVVVKVVREPSKLAGLPGRLLLVDLNLDGALDAARSWKLATSGTVTAFVQHTDAAAIAAARSAGIDRVMARGQFVQVLGDLLKEGNQHVQSDS
jgi:hypothetical protein